MPVLGIDTSTRTQSVALVSDGRPLAQVSLTLGTTHSETLLRAVDLSLSAAGRRLRDLDAIAATSGPGSFTGLRIGMATAKGLALAAGIPLAGISTLRVLAAALAEAAGEGAAEICALMDAGRGQVYRGLFRVSLPVRGLASIEALGPERVCAAEEALLDLRPGFRAGGDGGTRARLAAAGRAPEISWIEEAPPLAPVLARLTEAIHREGRLADHALAPNYVRPPDALKAAAP